MPFAALCERFGISRKTGYKWLNRFRARGADGLRPQSRRPKTSPRKTPATVVSAVLALRAANPDWSVTRLHQTLAAQGVTPLPGLSTVDLILRRQRQEEIARQQSLPPAEQLREPSFRWIVDLHAPLALADRSPVRPIIVRDAATDFWLTTELLCGDADDALASLIDPLLRRHGLPWRLVLPSGGGGFGGHTSFTLRLMRLGVGIEFVAAPPAPMADDVETRRRLVAKLAALPAYQQTALATQPLALDDWTTWAEGATGRTAAEAAAQLEAWRTRHNFGGSQEAMQRQAPVARFRPSPRVVPPRPAAWAPAPEAELRLVSEKGLVTFRRRLVQIGRVFAGETVELQRTACAEVFLVRFAGQGLGIADLSKAAAEEPTSVALRPI